MTDPDPRDDADEAGGAGDRPAGSRPTDGDGPPSVAAGRLRSEPDRIARLLSAEAPTDGRTLRRRAAASRAVAELAEDDPGRVRPLLPALIEALRAETARLEDGATGDDRATARAIAERLVGSLAAVLVDDPATVDRLDDPVVLAEAVRLGLDDGTVRAAARALYDLAGERPAALAPAAADLGALLGRPDPSLRAWAAGALGRLADECPEAVAPEADGLAARLENDEGPARHNALEALATLAGERPDAVAPAAPALRALLDADEPALRHNAAGALGRLAGTRPEAVAPAVPDLRDRCADDDAAVRRVATAALARLAEERPGAVGDG